MTRELQDGTSSVRMLSILSWPTGVSTWRGRRPRDSLPARSASGYRLRTIKHTNIRCSLSPRPSFH